MCLLACVLGDTSLRSNAPKPLSIPAESIPILTPSLYYKYPGMDYSWPSWKPDRSNSELDPSKPFLLVICLLLYFMFLSCFILTPAQPETQSLPTPPQKTGCGPPPALPLEFDGDRTRGMAFFYSCQMYIWLCPDLFSDDQAKITWALSYMKVGRAAKWVA